MNEHDRRVWAMVHVCNLGRPDEELLVRVVAVDRFLNQYAAGALPHVQAVLAALPRARELPLHALLNRAERLLALAGIEKMPAPAANDELPLATPDVPKRKARA